MKIIPKPSEREFAPYAVRYIGLLPDDGLVLKHLAENLKTTSEFLLSIPPERLLFRYAPGKWTIKEIVRHVTDDERIYSYRALRFARGDRTELPGFEQDAYALHSGANLRSMEDLVNEFATVRQATISLFEGFDEAALLGSGIASGNIMSVRAAAYHIAGHEMRHINLIKELIFKCSTRDFLPPICAKIRE
jgi:DinB superfamily